MRVRLRYTKLGRVRFVSHRDIARIWERAWRRTGLPIAYSEGFSPRAKMHFGLALSTGFESHAEYVDVDSPDGEDLDPAALPARLTPALPDGIDVTMAAVVDRRTPSLQESVSSCSWRIDVSGGTPASIDAAIAGLLDTRSLVVARERKGKAVHDDIRPYVLELATEEPGPHGPRLTAELGTKPRGLRPAELVAALDPALRIDSACRLHQWIWSGGAREEPLLPPATWTSHAQARAS